MSQRRPQKGQEEPRRQGNHDHQLLMQPELLGLYIVASVFGLAKKFVRVFHVRANPNELFGQLSRFSLGEISLANQ